MLGSNTVILQIFQQQILQCWYLYAESLSMFITDDIRCKWYCLILKLTKVFHRKCVGRKSVVWTSVSQHLSSHATKFIALTCIFFSMSHCPLRALPSTWGEVFFRNWSMRCFRFGMEISLYKLVTASLFLVVSTHFLRQKLAYEIWNYVTFSCWFLT